MRRRAGVPLMLREIVLDTETTGLDAAAGDRLIEIGCVEIVNRIPTGREFHRYLNPERELPRDAVDVHGLTAEFLKDKPLFRDVADEFLEFIGTAPLVAHNATFDLSFLNAERIKHGALMDSALLASVYVELLGERQATLGLGGQGEAETALELRRVPALPRPHPLPSRLMEAGEALHHTLVTTLGPKALWLRF